MISEVYANVVYAMGFSCVNRRLGADVSETVSRCRGNILDYNRILRPRGRRLVKQQRETGSSASMIRTDTMVFVLQQSTCLQCGAKQWREHPWRNSTRSSKKWRTRCVQADSIGKKGVRIFVEGAGSLICPAKLKH